jgi:hypothetical protein
LVRPRTRFTRSVVRFLFPVRAPFGVLRRAPFGVLRRAPFGVLFGLHFIASMV